MGWDEMGWDETGWDEMGWDEMGWDEMGWDEMEWQVSTTIILERWPSYPTKPSKINLPYLTTGHAICAIMHVFLKLLRPFHCHKIYKLILHITMLWISTRIKGRQVS